METELICKERIRKEVDVIEQRAEKAKKNYNILSAKAEEFAKIVFTILKKRGIKIKNTQMYFNNSYMNVNDQETRALVHIDFEQPIGEYNGAKAKHLEEAIRSSGVPCPIGGFSRSVTIAIGVED